MGKASLHVLILRAKDSLGVLSPKTSFEGHFWPGIGRKLTKVVQICKKICLNVIYARKISINV